MQFHAIEAGRQRVARCLGVFLDDLWDLAELQRAWRIEVLQAGLVGPHLAGCLYSRRRHRRFVGVAVQRVGDAADVHELHEHPAAPGVDGIRNLLPRGDLLLGVDRGRPRVAETDRGRSSAFCRNHAGGGALGVVGDRQLGRDAAGERAAPRHRRHHYSVSGVEAVDAAWAQQVDVSHGSTEDPVTDDGAFQYQKSNCAPIVR